MATAYSHRGGDLPLNPPDSYWGVPDEPMTCVECGETITDDVPDATSRVMNALNNLSDANHWCQPCVNECLDWHPRGATVRANLT